MAVCVGQSENDRGRAEGGLRLAVGTMEKLLPAAFVPYRCLSLSRSHVSSPSLIKPDLRISRIRRSDDIATSTICSDCYRLERRFRR